MKQKVAIVHDWLNGMRGGEKVLEQFLDLFPEADIFTLFLEEEKISDKIKNHKIFTSKLNRHSFVRNHYRYFLPFLPSAVEAFRLWDYDLVISSSHCVAKGVIPAPVAPHFCYIHSPMRYIWDQFDQYFGNARGVKRAIIRRQAEKLRLWDTVTAARVDFFIANSNFVKQRISKYYRRDAAVIHPPVDVELFQPAANPRRDFYLSVSAFVPYKNNHMLVEAFNRLELPLVLVGKGPEEERLRKMASDTITFKQNIPADELRELYQHAAGFVYAGVEDFGIAFGEAQACGVPVIAPAKGGVLDIVADGETGVLYEGDTVDDLVDAVKRSRELSFAGDVIRTNSLRFSEETFKLKIKEFIDKRI